MRKTIVLKKYTFSKKAFIKAPKHEQACFLRALDILTEIGILRRAMFFTMNREKLPKNIKSLVITAQTIQVFYFERVLSGVLVESRDFITNFKNLEPNLEAKRKTVYRIFSNTNFIAKKITRKKFAYHYDIDVIEENIAKIVTAADPTLYLTKNNLNSFYFFGNQAIVCALAKAGGFDGNTEDSLSKAYQQIHREIKDASVAMTNFLVSYTCQFLIKYLKTDLAKIPDYKLGKVSEAKDISLPYFAVWE